MPNEYVKPRAIRIERSRQAAKLYALEDRAAEEFKRAAQELGKLRGDAEADFYTTTLPQALYDFLDHWDTRAVVLACEAFLEATKRGR